MSDPIPPKSHWEKLNSFVAEVCEAFPFSAKEKSLEAGFQGEGPLGRALFERTLSWSRRFDRAELFSPLVPARWVDSGKTGLSLMPLPAEAETLKPFTGWVSARKYVALSEFEENVAEKLLHDGLDRCLKRNPELSADTRDTTTARQTFIENLAVNIVNPMAMDRFMAIMEGLLGDEPDAREWQELYDEHFGYSEQELAGLEEYDFGYDDDLAQSVAGDELVAGFVANEPKVSGYIAGLLLKAESLYGAEDPDFVEEYKEYVELTLNSLASENKLKDIVTLYDHLKTPEEYRNTGFLNLPERPENALSGSEFMQDVLGIDLEEFKKNPRQLGKLSKNERENAILEQIELGNVPDFLRRPRAVIIKGPNGEEVKTYVMPDYIAVGSNKDFVRVPLSPLMAQALALKYGLSLPTKTIVEETYLQAGKRVVGPSYTHPDEFEQNSPYLDSAGFYLRHSEDIQRQLQGVPLGTLVAGGKKELVVSPFVAVRFAGSEADASIDFYGLYDEYGIPIQRTPAHRREGGYQHTEYALGVRFVSPMVVVRDSSGARRVMKMEEALQDPEIAKILSRAERTGSQPNYRSPAPEGPFDASTAYRQNLPKGLKAPDGPGSA